MSLLTSLISAWELNEASGNALDSHGSNTLTDTNTVGSGTGLVSGTVRDFEFGSAEYFSHASNSDLQCGDIDFTFEAWFKFENDAFYNAVFAKGVGFGREYLLYRNQDASGHLIWAVGGTQLDSGVTITAGTWYHAVCWYDATADQLGVAVNDGTPATTSLSGGAATNTDDFRLGSAPDAGGLHWDGLIGPVRFWKRVLTSTERTTLYNSGAGLAYSSFGSGGTVSGTASVTVGDVTASGTGTVRVAGTAGLTVGDVTTAGTATVALKGSSTVTVGDVTAAGTGTVRVSGTAGVTVGDVTASGTAANAIQGVVSAALDAVGITATGGSGGLNGTAALTVGDVTTAGTATVRLAATAGLSVGDVTAAATGTVSIAGAVGLALSDVTAAGTGTVRVSGQLARTLNDVTISAAGREPGGDTGTQLFFIS